MKWLPQDGFLPRGFCGATGAASEVQLVLVVGEPGDPHPQEKYNPQSSPEDLLNNACRYAYGCFERGSDQFHRNLREYILDQCWPALTFHAQLRRTWITESVLCSAQVEGGSVPATVYKNCVSQYLERQLALFPQAVVAAVGSKAQNRMARLPRSYLKVGSVAPPGCNQHRVRESWQTIANEVHRRWPRE